MAKRAGTGVRVITPDLELAGERISIQTGGMSLDPSNPLAKPSTLPYQLPDFTRIGDHHYQPAIEAGLAEQLVELAAIAAETTPATAANVIDAWEESGELLTRALNAFYSRQPADTNPTLDAIEEAVAPQLASHHDAILLNPALHDRVRSLSRRVQDGEVNLSPEQAYWLERKLQDFARSGVNLPLDQQGELRQLNRRIAELQSAFGREALAGMNAAAVLVTDPDALDGLTPAQIEAARERAVQTGHSPGWLLELDNTTGQPLLAQLTNRALRKRIFQASSERGWSGVHDTRSLVVELARLRARRAVLLGFTNHADYVAEEACAKTGDAVWQRLTSLASPALANAEVEAAELQEALAELEPGAELTPWDWQFLAERVRAEKFDLDSAVLRPYLELERVLREGVFAAAEGLFGITFSERHDLHGYHPEVRVFEVAEADGRPVGLFLADFYTRPTKQGGAWMNNLVDQNHLLGQLPVVCNNLNLPKPASGQPTLLTWDEVITLFHEFGHALHGLLSDVRYRSQSGTETPADFVEFPSQVNEMWAVDEDLLHNYAVHHQTGESLPGDLVETLKESARFGQGYRTTEYLGAALLDQVWHRTPVADLPTDFEQVADFEARALASVGLDYPLVPPRYRTTYLKHAFEGGYDAGYYAYIWSEVLDADTVAFITDNGGLTRENGERYRRRLLARGGSIDSMDAYRDYRGQDPDLTHLLARRGLL